jgi:hypothetical protein
MGRKQRRKQLYKRLLMAQRYGLKQNRKRTLIPLHVNGRALMVSRKIARKHGVEV